ncbi:hypothetical protein QTO34_014261 [Cnephaeus nilssonii]|uniref:Uncharacterized protein n=1 Tax=Cnephaeus nilssonii TaxID=3371016 RepID=A0AA40LTU6_CNENI|nr:hypothetical protein QTO34_014261 [Eptesicus nilssonii]
MDELSKEDYWNEVDNIKKSSENRQDQEVVVVKEPDLSELEEWLKEAGLSNIFGESAGDPQESMVFLSTLTQTRQQLFRNGDGEPMTCVAALTRVAISDDRRPLRRLHTEDETFAAPEDETFAK